MKKKVRNPLIKRLPRELAGDWKKYLVVVLFLILTIGFVSGMYVANESMMTALERGNEKYLLEDGHFELAKKADTDLIAAIETGEKADVKQYYTDEAREELDEKFDDEFKEEFDKEFPDEFNKKFTEEFDKEFPAQFKESFDAEFAKEFTTSFDAEFRNGVKQQLLAQGLDEATAAYMLEGAVAQAKADGTYQTAYDTAYASAYDAAYDTAYSEAYTKAFDTAYNEAYDEAYEEAYDEAYDTAYDEAWEEICDEIEEKYADAEEKYDLNDPDFAAVPVTVYENFYRNEEEDYDNDGTSEGTVRVYTQTTDVNLASLYVGAFPETADEVAIDRMHADNVGVGVGDTITVGGEEYTISGLIAYVNYTTLHEKNTDMMFDAIGFDVAMVTDEGFDRLTKSIHYCYAWTYDNEPANEIEQKVLSDDFMKALLTQTVVADNEIEDYLPLYANQAVHFAPDDMGSDEAMGGVLLDILIVIIAFIFGITISNTIAKESSTIGTLRASGYTKGELVCHYLATPVVVTFLAAIIGNVLGYTVFKGVVVDMYYNSYSLPTYETIWDPDAFINTTVIPVVLMFVVNLVVITRMLAHTPLQFLRHDLKKNKRKKAIRLPKWGFLHRFRMRIIFQNVVNYIILFVGIFFIAVLLAMAVGMVSTLDYYKGQVSSMMFADYQVVLSSYEDEDGETITTDTPGAEIFSMTSLVRRSDTLDEEISVYGIIEGSDYVQISGFEELSGEEVYISAPYAEKYGISVGDTITLDEKYEDKQYSFAVAGIFEKSASLAVFLPIDEYREVFDQDEEAFSGYFSNTEITDIDEDYIATVITQKDITKMADQLDLSIGSYMDYFQVLCILLSAVLIYLLTKIIVEKNENAISMTKILGYNNGEIANLYLLSTAIMMVFIDAVSVLLGSIVMINVWRVVLYSYSGWFAFHIEPIGYVKMYVFIFLGYVIVTVFDFLRIKRVPMDEALKNVE